MGSRNSEAPMAATNEASNMSVTYEKLTMNSLAKSTANCTNSIIISDIKIHMDEEGRYSLNDLHKAAGKERRHEPANWINLEQTAELVNEILNTGIPVFKNGDVLNTGNPVFKPMVSKKGRYGGTYVCKELVYSYAMWISAAFALKVIRAYDALVSGDIDKATVITQTSTDDRTPLRGLVNRIMGKTGIHYQPLYKMIHREFGVNHIDELTQKQVAEAMEYLAGKVIEGELMPREMLEAPVARQFSDEELISLCYQQIWMETCQSLCKELYPAMKQIRSELSGKIFDIASETRYMTQMNREALIRETKSLDQQNFVVKHAQPMLAKLRGEEWIH